MVQAAMTTAIKSATRVLDVMELLSRTTEPLTHGEVAERLDIPKSSLTPLLRNLVVRRYAVGDGRVFSAGPSLREIARADGARRALPAFSQDVIGGLVGQLGESACLSVQRGSEAEVVETMAGPQRLVAKLARGHRSPLHAMSGGRAILAFLPDAFVDSYFEGRDLARYTPATVTSLPALRHRLRTIREEGIAWSFEEFASGSVGIGAPLRLPSGVVVGALNISVPTVRFDGPSEGSCARGARGCCCDGRQPLGRTLPPGGSVALSVCANPRRRSTFNLRSVPEGIHPGPVACPATRRPEPLRGTGCGSLQSPRRRPRPGP